VAPSYAAAILNNVGSPNGLAKNITDNGSLAGIGSSSLVPPGGYFFIADAGRRILVFWAHFGRNASDLYFGNHLTGDLSIVADRISEVTVTARRVFGIVRVSEQDLVGELVNKDLIHNQEIVLAHSVADAAAWGQRVAFVVRERVDSPNDGLWAIPIEGLTGMNTKPMPMPAPTAQ